jgi:putative two-component system response regulator
MIESTPQLKKPKIMIVDDAPDILDLLREMLEEHGSEVFALPSGIMALHAAEKNPPDLLLLDISMPEMDGYQVCERFKRNPRLKEIPIIFLSGLSTTEDKVKAFEAGGVDYITKPFHPAEVRARIGTHLNLRSLQYKLDFQKLVAEKVREISEAQQATIFALAKLAENRDEDTGAHLERVREYCRLLAERLGSDSPYAASVSADFIDCIQHAAPLHDIGKVAIPDRILLKPGRLTPEEFEIMKTHAVIGAENLQTVYNNYAGNVFIGMGIEIALYHHERWDGTGYPDGLVGRNIPLSARIMAVADCYDAIHSDRCYRKGSSHEETKAMIMAESGSHFDPEVCVAFLALEKEFGRIMKFLCW